MDKRKFSLALSIVVSVLATAEQISQTNAPERNVGHIVRLVANCLYQISDEVEAYEAEPDPSDIPF